MSGMGARTAEEAVYELLGQPTRTPVLVSGRAQAAPQPFQHRAWTADLDTVDFLKQRELQGVRLFAVSFEAEHERRGFTQMAILVRADQIGRAWMARRITGASGSGELPSTAPRVNLGGSWGRHGFCGGGRVDPAGADLARVRLRFANGVELDDDTTGGWVLFFTSRPVERPNAVVELLDRSGDLISSFDWPWSPDLPEELRRRIRG